MNQEILHPAYPDATMHRDIRRVQNDNIVYDLINRALKVNARFRTVSLTKVNNCQNTRGCAAFINAF